MKFKNLILVVAMFSLILAGCADKKTNGNVEENLDNLNKSGMPIVKEQIEFDIFAPTDPATADWNDLLIWNDYREKTNIDIKWEQVADASLEEKRNLRLASDDIPDAFYAAGIKNLDLFKYGKQGTFIPLNDLIEEYAPNLSALMDEYPEVRQAITFPDGNIYSMPTIQDPEFLSLLVGARPWFNSKFLEKLDMDIPETTDEFYDYLTAVKNSDLNENGTKDEVPYAGRNVHELVRWLRGSFGLSKQNHAMVDLEEDGDTIRFIPTTDQYKDMLMYIRKLYEEELINQNIFTIENDQFLANGSEEIYGSTVFYSPDETFGTDAGVYIGGLPLAGPDGEQSYSKSNAVGRVDGLVITKNNENPAAMVRWLDHFYTEEGSRYQYMGIEGETYEVDEDGNYHYVEEITNSPDGLTLDQEINKRLAWVGIWPAGVMRQDYFMGSETSNSSLEATEKLEPYLSEESWPAFMYTEDETKVISSKGADIEKYVEEMRDKFISGDESFSNWDKYVETIENIGLEDYLEVQQAAYDRYADHE